MAWALLFAAGLFDKPALARWMASNHEPTPEAFAAAAEKTADVIVARSQNEPLGVSVLEAIYTGCFPVLTALGSFPTVLPPEHHDLLYDGSLEARSLCDQRKHVQ